MHEKHIGTSGASIPSDTVDPKLRWAAFICCAVEVICVEFDILKNYIIEGISMNSYGNGGVWLAPVENWSGLQLSF